MPPNQSPEQAARDRIDAMLAECGWVVQDRKTIAVPEVQPGFIEAAFAAGATRHYIESKIRTTAGQAGVSGGDIKSAPVPVCSREEQEAILSFLDESLTAIDTQDSDLVANLQKAEALRQAIL